IQGAFSGAAGFLNLSQSRVRPARYREPSRFDTIPSQPSAQACLNTMSPGSSNVALTTMPASGLRTSWARRVLRRSMGSGRRSLPSSSIRSSRKNNSPSRHVTLCALVALGKTIRAMADDTLDSQVGSRICNGLGIMRQCLETQTLDRLGERLDHLENTRGEGVSYGTTKHDQPHHVAH